jgi:hypothetical protein
MDLSGPGIDVKLKERKMYVTVCHLIVLRRPDVILARLWIVRHEFTIFEFGA